MVRAASAATAGSPALPIPRPGDGTSVKQGGPALLRNSLLLSRSRGGDLLAEDHLERLELGQ